MSNLTETDQDFHYEDQIAIRVYDTFITMAIRAFILADFPEKYSA